MGEMIEFPSNGSTAVGYLATPEAGPGPGIIVIQEWWGLVDHIRDVCDRSKTDVRMRARPARFYRQALAKHFEPLGCGLYHVRGGDKLFYELERG